MIHPTAIIDPKAELDPSVEVGPYAIIDGGVKIGAGCKLGPFVHLTGETTIGINNRFHTGCVIGDEPQDLKYKGEPTRLRIGDNNIFREHANVHRSNQMTEDTVIGSHNMLMANSHIGHNVILGDHIIVANGVLIAGHATVGDRVFLSGNSLVHQFVRIGTLALMQGGAAISKDLPPYCIARGDNGICGLNVIGLRRSGMPPEERLQLKQAYHALFRSHDLRAEALEKARARFDLPSVRLLMDFVAASKRGICADTGFAPEEE